MEMSSVRSTSPTEARMVVVRSRTMVVSMPSGMDGLDRRQLRAYASTVAMMLAPGWRKMITDDRRACRSNSRPRGRSARNLSLRRHPTGGRRRRC